MATVVTTSSAPAPGDFRAGKEIPAAVPFGGKLQVYKPGEGHTTRLGMMVMVMAYTFFACHHWWYSWVLVRDVVYDAFSTIGLGKLFEWTTYSTVANYLEVGGTAALAAAGFCVGYYFIYLKRATAEFLIKTDGELNKVAWPRIVPWFKADTEVWGATYVVLIVIVALTLYIFGIDLILQKIAQLLFYGTGR